MPVFFLPTPHMYKEVMTKDPHPPHIHSTVDADVYTQHLFSSLKYVYGPQ
jgi:hypothetical protein